MPGYDTHIRSIDLGGLAYRIRSLVDIAQFADPDGNAHRVGISSSQWILFGHVWPCSRMLAHAMTCHDVSGRRILEVGCGLGLASLVLRERGADITASDCIRCRSFLLQRGAHHAGGGVPHARLGSPSANWGVSTYLGRTSVQRYPPAASARAAVVAAPDSEVVIATGAATARFPASCCAGVSRKGGARAMPRRTPPYGGCSFGWWVARAARMTAGARRPLRRKHDPAITGVPRCGLLR